MTDRDYKKCPGLSRTVRAALLILCLVRLPVLRAGPREDQITLGTLKRVESIAGRETSRETFGKSTLQESAVLLDLSTQAVPGLLKHLKSRKGDWKARFWAVDMLGYVGNASAVRPLRGIASDKREKVLVRKRARRALKEIAARP